MSGKQISPLLCAVLLCLLWAAAAAAAQTAPPLSLQDCVRIALDRNPQLQAARHGVTAAEEAAGAARAPYWPSLSAAAGYRRWDRVVFLPEGVERPGVGDTVGETDEWHANLQAEYLLFDSGRRRAELLVARAERGVAGEEEAQTRQELVLLVHEAYFRLLGGLAEAAAAEESLRRRQEHVQITETRFQAGDVPQADVLRARVEAANARLDQVQAQNSARLARADLNAAMGLSPLTPLQVEEAYPQPLLPADVELEQAVAAAQEQRPELAVAEYRRQAAEQRVAASRGAYGPRLQAEGWYGRRDDRFLPEAQDWSLGASLRVPLFTGFERTRRVAEAKAERARSAAQKEDVGLQVGLEVANAHSRLVEAAETVEATDALVTDARESLRLTRARYENGAGTLNDLLDAEAALASAEARQVQARAEQQIATARFLRAVGGLGAEVSSF